MRRGDKRLFFFFLSLYGTWSSSAAEAISTPTDHSQEVSHLRNVGGKVDMKARHLLTGDSMCEGDIPGIQKSDVCCPTTCGECGGDGCAGRDGGSEFSGQEACCGGGVRSLDRVCSDTVGAPCVVSADSICEGNIPGIQVSDVCCPISCGACGGGGCTGRNGGSEFSGQEACCGGGVRSLDRVCSDTVGAPCVVSADSMCEGDIPGIQVSDVCCSTTCGECGGDGCAGRNGGSEFSGQEACCGGGVRSLNRICSDTVGAPCVVSVDPIPAPSPAPVEDSTPAPTPAPVEDPTPAPTPAPIEDATVCELELAEVTVIPTPLGGSTLTMTTSSCEFHPSAIFNISSYQGDLLAVVSGTFIDVSTAKITLPPLAMDTKNVAVTTNSATDGVIRGNIEIYGVVYLLDDPGASLGNADGTTRDSIITDPPSDVQLDWDSSLISEESVDIVLVLIVEDTQELQDVGVVGTGPNTGSYLIPSTALEGFDLGSSFVMFKIVGGISSGRRLQTSGIDPIAFPEVVTTGQIAWIEDLEGLDGTSALCGTAFTDDYSKCQCFFTAEKLKEGRGLQVNAFDEQFRCPSAIECILDAPPGLVTEYLKFGVYTYEDLASSSLISGWKNDLACPFGSCEFDSAGDDRELLSCKRGLLGGNCGLHKGAEFCVRTDEATSGGVNNGIGNQCCYDAAGKILADATTGGGTVDMHESEVGMGFFVHISEDVRPFEWCCGDGDAIDFWLCQLYIEMRPVDAGDSYIGSSPSCSATPSGGTLTSMTQTFSVQVPELAESSVDFGLLVDVSGSYSDDIASLQALAGDLVEGLSTDFAGVDVEDLRLALGSYSDFPDPDYPSTAGDVPYTQLKPFGSCGDAETEEQISECFAQEQTTFVNAVNSLGLQNGGDGPESQTVALVSAAEGWDWRDAALKILAITTDAGFHLPGDGSTNEGLYFSLEQVIAACTEKNIKILALKAPGAGTEMDTIADGTGGVVETTSSDSSDIVEKILAGIQEVKYTKIDIEWACRDSDFEKNSWTHTQSDPYEDVAGGVELDFTVTVSVPAGVTAGIRCVALVVADEVLIGGQEFIANSDGTITASSIAPLG